VILIEYLSNTAALTAPRTFLCCLPLKVMGADGAPARVVALEEPRSSADLDAFSPAFRGTG
jgi:arylformamidase